MSDSSKFWRELAVVLGVAAVLGLSWILGPVAKASAEPRPDSSFTATPQAAAWGRVPLYFIENRGQVDRRVKYYAQQGRQAVFFTAREIVLSLPAATPAAKEAAQLPRARPSKTAPPQVVRIKPVGLKRGAQLRAENPTPCRVNYFRGNNPQKWRTNIPTYQAVVYEEAYAGIDLKFYGRGRELEYDVVVKPGADPAQVRFAYQGVKKLELTPAGDLALLLPDGGRLLQKKPVVYQEINGVRVAREARFRLQGQGAHLTCGFAVAAYDPQYSLILDPILSFATYLGGTDNDQGQSLAVDQSGAVYVAGETKSLDFPTSNPLQGARAGDDDLFIVKLSPAGNSLIYATYLGGTDEEHGPHLALDQCGAVYIAARTSSTDFPICNPFQWAKAGGFDVIVVKLNPAGNLLNYSTYLGGTENDYASGIAIDQSGAAYVTGYTHSSNFPTRLPLQAGKAGGLDAFVVKLSPTGNYLSYATYLGGTDNDYSYGIAVDQSGAAYITGKTSSSNFPTYNPLQWAKAGGEDAFVAKLSPIGNALSYSTYLGGTSNDSGQAIAVDQGGAAYIVGTTFSSNFPTHNPLQGANAGGQDIFVARLRPAGNLLSYATYLGGTLDDYGLGLALDARGAVYLTGYTSSSNFPTQRPLQGSKAGGFDAFVAKLDLAGNFLSYATYLGGSANDWGASIAVAQSGAAYICGFTYSTDFPTYQPLQGTSAGNLDAFVVKILDPSDLLPTLQLLLLD